MLPTGTIATQIGRLTKLTDLQLWDNELSGESPLVWNIPRTFEERIKILSKETNDKPRCRTDYLTIWPYIFQNSPTGAIPTQIGHLTNLQYLYLLENQLSGKSALRTRLQNSPRTFEEQPDEYAPVVEQSS